VHQRPAGGNLRLLTARDSAGFIGGTTSDRGRQTISGLVPDGDPTATVVLADGTQKIVPVVDHNVFETTVPGRIVAIINRNAAGRIERQSLQ
jgi:hypothetical protein